MPTEGDLQRAADSLTGDILQVPPMASAVKVGGERLYKLHRRGVTVERESRPVTVHKLSVISYEPGDHSVTFHISCSSGTYVRTLVSDLAAILGTGAYLTALRRTSVGHLSLEKASFGTDLEEINPDSHLISAGEVVAHLPVVEIPVEVRRDVCNGRALSGYLEGTVREEAFRVEVGGELLGVYRRRGNEARAEVVLCG